jgi:hypothetical protein
MPRRGFLRGLLRFQRKAFKIDTLITGHPALQ